jgi:hypothetical protein
MQQAARSGRDVDAEPTGGLAQALDATGRLVAGIREEHYFMAPGGQVFTIAPLS